MSDPGARLHVVSGKGGVGKTTVAASLALGLAAQGQRVLLAEVEGRQGISQALGVPALDTTETKVADGTGDGGVWGLSVDAKAALLEYLQMFYKLGRAGGLLERFGVMDFTTSIAPGLRDVLLIGRIYEAANRRPGKRAAADRIYDAIVLDAPPTGRIGRFLAVGDELAGLAKGGPIKAQADSVGALLTSDRTRVHLVTLLEEMPVRETVEAIGELRALSLRIGTVVVNQEHEPVVPARARAALRDPDYDDSTLNADLTDAGLRVGERMLDGLVQAGVDLDDRLALQETQRADLAGLDLTTASLPLLPDAIDPAALRRFGDALIEQGMTSAGAR